MSKALLNRYRETQNVTRSGVINANIPGWCYSAAKFFTGKAIGLYHRDTHLWDFYKSKWFIARKDKTQIIDSWNRRSAKHVAYFNKYVINATVHDSSTGIAIHSKSSVGIVERLVQNYEITSTTNTTEAIRLLRMKVPLIAAVDMVHATRYTSGQDHWLTLVPCGGDIWIVDPWGVPARTDGVIKLPLGKFGIEKIHIKSSSDDLVIPPKSPLYFYYRYKGAEAVKVTLVP